jgi:hypothetical protein
MTNPTDAFAATEKGTAQVREFGDRAAGTGRAISELVLDAYEKAVASFVEFEHRAAEATPVDWVKAAISAHASFVEDINGAYVKAARDALN